jgi:hypothetical protein
MAQRSARASTTRWEPARRRPLVYQFSGILYSEYGQRAFLAMTVVSALGLCALLLLARTWNGGQLVGHAEARA